MIYVRYLGSNYIASFDLEKEPHKFVLDGNMCPSYIQADGYELNIIKTWNNIPITNNDCCVWSGEMAWFIAANMEHTIKTMTAELRK